jgi:hypothetical protein
MTYVNPTAVNRNQATTSEDYNRLMLRVCYSDLLRVQYNDCNVITCDYETLVFVKSNYQCKPRV